jgi:hypothetical protein
VAPIRPGGTGRSNKGGFAKPFDSKSHLYFRLIQLVVLTRKELIEGGWIDKYILGLTSEMESEEVERLANIYPDVQAEINRTRGQICGKFNRHLTQPALRHSLLTKRRVLYGSGLIVFILLTGMAFLYKEHCSLRDSFYSQSQRLADDEEKLIRLSSFSKMSNERSSFLHAAQTKRIKLKGCGYTPDAEVMVFQCRMSGKMMLHVIDLPELKAGQHYEVWAQSPDEDDRLLGKIIPPVRFDSLYVLDTVFHFTSLQINAMDPATMQSEPICMAAVSR